MKAGHSYTFDLWPGIMGDAPPMIDLALYLFTDCANAAGTCGPGMGADMNMAGGPEHLTYAATADGTILIGVDDMGGSPGLPTGGSFTLEVK